MTGAIAFAIVATNLAGLVLGAVYMVITLTRGE